VLVEMATLCVPLNVPPAGEITGVAIFFMMEKLSIFASHSWEFVWLVRAMPAKADSPISIFESESICVHDAPSDDWYAEKSFSERTSLSHVGADAAPPEVWED
jgi:hypothetical protein